MKKTKLILGVGLSIVILVALTSQKIPFKSYPPANLNYTKTQNVSIRPAETNKSTGNGKYVTTDLSHKSEIQTNGNQKHYELDLSTLDLTVEGNDIIIKDNDSKLNNIKTHRHLTSNESDNLLEKRNFTKQILAENLKNDKYKSNIKDIIKQSLLQHNTIAAIGVTEFTAQNKENSSNNSSTSVTPLSTNVNNNYHIEKLTTQSGGNSYNPDSTAWLYTTVSWTVSSQVWAQTNLYWSSAPSAGGRDCIAIAWDDPYRPMNNSDRFSSSFANGSAFSTSPSRCIATSHEIGYSYLDSFEYGNSEWYTNGVYLGVTLLNGTSGYHTFYSEYIHTYYNTSYSFSIGYGWPSVSVSPSVAQYPVQSYCSVSL